jgi:hypothetical protein
MDDGRKRNKVRLTLLATMVAATGALVAAPTQAKAPPEFKEVPSVTCSSGIVTSSFDVVGKGKWVFLDVAVIRDGVVNDNPPLWDDERKDGSRQIPFSTAVSAGGNVALKVTLVNRKGQPYGEAFPNVVTTLGDDC